MFLPKKKGKIKALFFLTVCPLDFRAAARGTGLSQLFDIQHHVQRCFSSQDTAKRMVLCTTVLFLYMCI